MTAPVKRNTVHMPTSTTPVHNPWNALWAMMVGFFMILVDSTIVAVANPSIMEKLDTDYDTVLWVTSAYLLAYAVPLLVSGRLGDRFGPKNLYLIGLFVFTAASLWCGLAGSIAMLVAARVVQGIGAALLTPQTLSTITRTFPPERRGMAMSVWGATAGVATLVGPLAGGVLVDHLGWQWIFFVNVPIGVLGLAMAAWLIPTLPTQTHNFDWLGVVMSGLAMFLVVFGLQEGEDNHWSGWIWAMVGGGVAMMGLFVYWQSINKREPLVPLRIFRDRDFSLANVGVAVIGFAVTAMVVPTMFYAQVVCGLTPTRSALLTAPMAVATGLLAPVVGRIVDRAHPRPIIGFGFSVLAIALTWLSIDMTPTTPIWRLLLSFTAMGIGMAFIWAPLAATATRNLAPALAGAGSGVYNATRQLGSVLGSAGIAAFMSSRISDNMPGGAEVRPQGAMMQLPEFLRVPFSAALAQSMLLPAFVALFGVVAALFLAGTATVRTPARRPRREDATEVIPVVRDDAGYPAPPGPFWRGTSGYGSGDHHSGNPLGHADEDDEDDEFTVETEPDGWSPADDHDTEPLRLRVDHLRPAPAEVWHSAPVESWHSLLTDSAPAGDRSRVDDPIGFAHNGFHVDDDHEKIRPVPPPAAPAPGRDRHTDGFRRLAEDIDSFSESFADFLDEQRAHRFEAHGRRDPLGVDEPPARHGQPGEPRQAPPNGQASRPPRHYRDDPDNSGNHGRHRLPPRD